MENAKKFFNNRTVRWILSSIIFIISIIIFFMSLRYIHKLKNKELNPKTDGETTSIIISGTTGTTVINEDGDIVTTIIDEESGEEITVVIDTETGVAVATTTDPSTGETITKVIATKPTSTTNTTIKVDATYTNVEEMKKSNIGEGKKVLTKGYYSTNDGGSGYYNIVKTAKYSADNGRVIKLNSGLFAVLDNSDSTTMSVKQYGVKGDGSSSDTTQMNALLNAGYNSVYFPAGTYNMNNYLCKPSKYIEIVGDGKQKTVIKNFGIEVKYGIKLENASFEGAPSYNFYTLTNQSVLVRLFLKDNNNSVTFNNFSFEDMDIVSALRVDGTYSLKFDHVTGCDFKNIRRAGVYHSANIKESIYTGNTFIDIGSKSINRGFVSAIWLGDVTNVTYTESNNVTIKNNSFNHFMTADDPSMEKHVINGNVIAIKANKAIIDNNYVNNIDGIGEDREAVYSKVKYLTVSNNTIINGGYGEGYITSKNQDGLDAFATITGNTITGEYGVGIYNYGSGLIKNNTINIKHAKGAITCHYRDATSKTLTIESNIIKLGAGSYQYNGSAIPNYGPGNIIVISGQKGNVFVKNNKINLTATGEKFSVGIDVSMLRKNATITGNIIEGANALSTGMMIHANESTIEECKDSVVIISDNSIKGLTGIGISFYFTGNTNVVSTRRFDISNNIIYSNANYGVYLQDSASANDTLIYTAPTGDPSNNGRARAVNVKNITDNSGLVVSG
ncbi:MAG: hypothetical protein IJS56_06515 [Bacilli bacterium]|nr:hypothetical protein [Bacilli bacterium]